MAVGGAAKVGVFAPFPVKDQLPGVDSFVSSSPSWSNNYSFALSIGFFGFWRLFARFLSPVAAIRLVILTGLGLYAHEFPRLAKCVVIGIPKLLIVVFISQVINILNYFLLYGHMPAVLAVAGAYNNKHPDTQLSCRVDRAGLISAAPWIKVPYPFQWGRPTFDAGNVFVKMAAFWLLYSLIVRISPSTGTIIVVSRYGSATPLPPSVLSRGIGWLVGHNQLVSLKMQENSGLFLLPIPLPIVAALYCVIFAYVVLQLNSFRTKFILGFSLFLGLPVPQYFKEYLLVSGRGPVHTVWRTSQPAETVAGTGGRGSDILVKTPGVRSSLHYLGTLTGFSLHSNFGALSCHQRKAEKK
ncbi:hypothetical protein POTOM_005825 [Populus tomentosa]|uniref:Uncharacterized protein n=1 Tax=Populus tomentosa TaxID=118781 RepID=A0A8X8AJZ0_POPTO|nr:hypothetical protein POTOM_005825 [Populus tomentosa]